MLALAAEGEVLLKKNKDRDEKFLSIVLLILIMGMSIFLGYNLRQASPAIFDHLLGKTQSKPPVSSTTPVDWKKIQRIKSYIENQYNGPIVDSKLLEGALKGMVSTLDNAGGQYFNAREYSDILNRNNMTHGTGIRLGVREGRIIVISTDPESQGEKVGVIPGDLLIKVNDQVVSAGDIESVRNVLRSNENRTVQLNLMRDNDHVEVNVRLRELKKPAIMTQLHENIGIIHFSEVALGTDDEFTAAMNDLVNQGAASFILDLRDTPSGLLTESVSIASHFVPSGQKVVSLRDTRGKIRDFTSKSGKYAELPLVVLINGQTEGTAEFIAGALKGAVNVTLVGQKTLGEGRSYSYINLPEGEGIKLATGYFLLPNGDGIQSAGVTPDIEMSGKRIVSPTLIHPEDTQMKKALEVIQTK